MPPLLTGLGVLAVTFVGSLLLPVLVMLVLPGRKGTMRTVRETTFATSVDGAWQVMAARLQYEGFNVNDGGRPNTLTAERPARTYHEAGQDIITHATKPLGIEIAFEPVAGGAHLTIALWMNDFILHDSGEGRYIDAMLDRLIAAELDREPAPVVPSTTLGAIVAATGGAIALTISTAPLYSDWLSGAQLFAFGLGVCGAGFYAIMMAKIALAAIRARPAEVTGRGTSWLAMMLGSLAVLPGAWWAFNGFVAMSRNLRL